MKRVILILMMLLPAAVAWEGDSNYLKQQLGVGGSVQEGTSSRADYHDVSSASSLDPNPRFAAGQQSSAPPPPPPKGKPSPKPGEEAKRSKIEGSMVGYIDNAIVGSQVRIRFDAAFNDRFPDRSEFFYAKCSCFRHLQQISPQAVDPNAPGPGLGVPKDVNFQQLYFYGEYAPIERFSLLAQIPVRWIQPQGFLPKPPNPPFTPFGNEAGLGDVMAGFKVAALTSSNHYLTFQFRAYFPSGDASRGLGTNHYSVEPAVLYYQKLSERLAVEAQAGDWHPIGGSAGVPITGSEGFAGDVFFYGIGPSYRLYNGERIRFTPVVELVGWNVRSGFQTQPLGPVLGAASEVSGTNIVNLKIGARTTFAAHSSFYLGYGRALTSAHWYTNIIRAEYRYAF